MTPSTSSSRFHGPIWLIILCAGLGGAWVGTVGKIASNTGLPSIILLIVALVLALVPLLIYRWRLTLAFLLLWLVVEDLIRKFSGNDLRIYLMKDVIFLILLAGLAMDPNIRGSWIRATRRSRFFLYGLIGWAVLMAVPTALSDWRLALIGLHMYFFYVPLVVAGFSLARREHSIRAWVVGAAIGGGAVCLIGLVQVVVGPEFLAPQTPVYGLENLVLVRGTLSSGPIYRPTGTFVDPGRFASAAVISLALSLATLVGFRKRRLLGAIAAMVSASAVWFSGERASVLKGAFIILVAILAIPIVRRRVSFGVPVMIAAGLVSITFVVSFFLPDLFLSRLAWYEETLSPVSPRTELSSRTATYASNAIDGISIGGFLGKGTGRESLGKQYLYGEGYSTPGLYLTEGGYAAVAVEMGVIGLALWIVWSFTWIKEQYSRLREASDGRKGLGLVLIGWSVSLIFLHFLYGVQVFQNFVANAFFWFFSGIVLSLDQPAEK